MEWRVDQLAIQKNKQTAMARSSPARQHADDHAQPSPVLPQEPLEESTRKWVESEEAALIAYWRDHAEQYATKTKRFFYEDAARIPALRRKTAAQIKSKCYDIEKRYNDTNMMMRALGETDPDASRRWIQKKFSLYFDVHPFLGQQQHIAPVRSVLDADDSEHPTMSATAAALATTAAALAVPSDAPSPPPAGVRSVVAHSTGKKRVLIGGSIPRSPPAPRAGKRHRAAIERFVKAAEDAENTSATANGAAVRATAHGTDSAAAAGSVTFSATGAPHIQENSAMVEAATAKLRAEAKLATIRANAALLRERKALLDEGIAVSEIDALLPLESAS